MKIMEWIRKNIYIFLNSTTDFLFLNEVRPQRCSRTHARTFEQTPMSAEKNDWRSSLLLSRTHAHTHAHTWCCPLLFAFLTRLPGHHIFLPLSLSLSPVFQRLSLNEIAGRDTAAACCCCCRCCHLKRDDLSSVGRLKPVRSCVRQAGTSVANGPQL